jgi:GNAT superfamily N-acetyltransferase
MDAAAGELNVTVPARHRGAGIGSSLVQRLADTAGHLGYRGLAGRVGADNAAGRALAHRQGFEVHRTNLGFALSPTDLPALRRVVSDAGERGIEIRILHRALDQRHLLEVLMACTPGLPGLTASIGSSAVLRHFPTDASFLAVEVDGIPAGIGVVHRVSDSDVWYTDFTGVIPEFRGRGLSKVLKAAELIEVADRGGRVLETHNDDTNLGMIRVNEEFGGVPVESILVLGRGL